MSRRKIRAKVRYIGDPALMKEFEELNQRFIVKMRKPKLNLDTGNIDRYYNLEKKPENIHPKARKSLQK